ncbi:MAG: hypothetical protein QXS02_03080 [Candidatus Thermoplasmatota archaeon]
MRNERPLEELRMKAHGINCELSEAGYTPRDIEIIGYYLNRIAASYLSYLTHKEYGEVLSSKEFTEKVEEVYQKTP